MSMTVYAVGSLKYSVHKKSIVKSTSVIQLQLWNPSRIVYLAYSTILDALQSSLKSVIKYEQEKIGLTVFSKTVALRDK